MRKSSREHAAAAGRDGVVTENVTLFAY